MSDLFSILIPLQTLRGWQPAPERSVVELLIVLIAIPVVASLVIGLVAMGGSLARKGQQGGSVRRKEPVWLGSTASQKAIAADSVTTTQSGGASVRW